MDHAPCPPHLYTSRPVFPWAPVVVDPITLQGFLKKRLIDDDVGLTTPSAAGNTNVPLSNNNINTTLAADQLEASIEVINNFITSNKAEFRDGQLEAFAIIIRHLGNNNLDKNTASELCTRCGFKNMSDTILLLLVSQLVVASSSHVQSQAVATHIVLPQLRQLHDPPSRDMMASVEHFVGIQPQAFLDGCVEPLLTTTPLNAHHAQLLVHIVKKLPDSSLPRMLRCICNIKRVQHQLTAPSNSDPEWNVNTIAVLQSVIDRKPQLSEEDMRQLVLGLESAVNDNASLVKFSKLLMTVVKLYWSNLSDELRQRLRRVCEGVTSFMKKSLLAACDKA